MIWYTSIIVKAGLLIIPYVIPCRLQLTVYVVSLIPVVIHSVHCDPSLVAVVLTAVFIDNVITATTGDSNP
jgi:hypothetical protein